MGKFIKWLAIGAFALIVLIIGAGVALPYLVPLDDIVAEGTAQVEKATQPEELKNLTLGDVRIEGGRV